MDLPTATVTPAADLPTRHGAFRRLVSRDERAGTENVALVNGEVWGRENVLVRLHSECEDKQVS